MNKFWVFLGPLSTTSFAFGVSNFKLFIKKQKTQKGPLPLPLPV